MSLNAYERETIISLCDGEDTATVYTASPKWMRKFDRLCDENPADYRELIERRQFAGDCIVSKMYTMPKELVSIRSKKRQVSEKQRENARALMEKLRASQI